MERSARFVVHFRNYPQLLPLSHPPRCRGRTHLSGADGRRLGSVRGPSDRRYPLPALRFRPHRLCPMGHHEPSPYCSRAPKARHRTAGLPQKSCPLPALHRHAPPSELGLSHGRSPDPSPHATGAGGHCRTGLSRAHLGRTICPLAGTLCFRGKTLSGRGRPLEDHRKVAPRLALQSLDAQPLCRRTPPHGTSCRGRGHLCRTGRPAEFALGGARRAQFGRHPPHLRRKPQLAAPPLSRAGLREQRAGDARPNP